VADAHSEKKKGGLTRGKAVLIAVLAVVLVVVMYIQFGRSNGAGSDEAVAFAPRRPPGVPPVTAAKPNAETANTTTSPASESETVAMIDVTRWKSPKLTDVVAHDPFALPVTFPQPAKVVFDPSMTDSPDVEVASAADKAKQLADAVEQLQRQLDGLKQRGVQVIVRERDQYAAMIGDRMVHVGDEIDGFVITAIRPDGVQVEGKVGQ
jgi:hypothetical protein